MYELEDNTSEMIGRAARYGADAKEERWTDRHVCRMSEGSIDSRNEWKGTGE